MPTPRSTHFDFSSSVRKPNWQIKLFPLRAFTRYTGASYTLDFFLSLACQAQTKGGQRVCMSQEKAHSGVCLCGGSVCAQSYHVRASPMP